MGLCRSRRVLEQARALDRMARASRLHGVPFGIKDIIDTADLPTEYNSPMLPRPPAEGRRRERHVLAPGRLPDSRQDRHHRVREHHPSQTRNPHNAAHTPGGSSSGSAAAVADFMVPAALGTQTGGSVIRPAAYCGAFAIKPTFGAINRAGTKSSPSRSTPSASSRAAPRTSHSPWRCSRAARHPRHRASRASACAARRAGRWPTLPPKKIWKTQRAN